MGWVGLGKAVCCKLVEIFFGGRFQTFLLISDVFWNYSVLTQGSLEMVKL